MVVSDTSWYPVRMGKAAPLTDLGPTLRDLIARSGKKQVDLARYSGVPETTISAIKNERLKSQPDEVLVALARALEVSPEVLREADRRPRRGDDLGIPESLRNAFHDAKTLISEEAREEYYQDVTEDVLHITRRYVERQRGPSRYPRRLK